MGADELRKRDGRKPAGLRWLAISDGVVAGAVTTFVRPDGRRFVLFACEDVDAYDPLTLAVHAATGGTLHSAVDAAEGHQHPSRAHHR